MKLMLIKVLFLFLLFISGVSVVKEYVELKFVIIFIVGDFIVVSYSNVDYQGWGEFFKVYFDSKMVMVDNCVCGG